MWPDFGRGHRVTTKTTCTTTTMTATVTTTTTTTAAASTTGRGLGIRGVNWKWATATTFPQSDARCNFSHKLAGQKAAHRVARDTGGRAGSTRFDSFPISPGIPSHRFTVSCLSAPQLVNRFPRLHHIAVPRSLSPQANPPTPALTHCIDYRDFSPVSSRIHVTLSGPQPIWA